jgi:hypothetical protein
MPQLPSGRKVGTSPIYIDEIVKNPLSHLSELGQVTNIEGLYPLLVIIEFMRADEVAPENDFAESSRNLHEVSGLKQVLQEITIADVLGKKTDWSDQDVDAFANWLDSINTQQHYMEIYNSIEEAKASISDHVDALAFTDIESNQDEAERFQRASAYVDAIGRMKSKESDSQ